MKSAQSLLQVAAIGPVRSIRPVQIYCRHVKPSAIPCANAVAVTQRPFSSLLTTHSKSSTSSFGKRAFTSSKCLQKKGGKQAREEARAANKDAPVDDPFDFTLLEADIAKAVEHLKDDLSKLRAGGRFNHEVLEVLRVTPEKGAGNTVRLSDVAQVIPKQGREVHIMVGESDHVKPVTSAIQGSSLSLTPVPDPTGRNPLLLIIKVPPPTADTRRAAVAEAVKAGDKASNAVRDARSKQQKKQRTMEKDKSARPDDLKKASKEMEKVVEKGTLEVKRIVGNAKKVLESG